MLFDDKNCLFCRIIFYVNIYNYYGASVTRLCLWMMCCERILATLTIQTYENKNNKFAGCIIFLIPLLYGLNVVNIQNVWPEYNNKINLFNLIFEFITLLLLGILLIVHIKLKGKIRKGTLKLNEKYQIKDNTKLFKWFIPLILIFSIINICYTIYQYIIKTLLLFKDDIQSLHNSLLFIAYIIIEIMVLIKRLKKKKKTVQICEGDVCVRIPKKNGSKIVQERLKKAKESGGGEIKLVTSENKAINLNYDQQSYFNILKQSW